MSMDDNDSVAYSTATTTSSVDETISIISNEIRRKRSRLNVIRRNSIEGKGSDNSMKKKKGHRSIMTASTLQESIDGGIRSKMRKRRRRSKLKQSCNRSTTDIANNTNRSESIGIVPDSSPCSF